MEKDADYFTVGIFVCLALVGLTGFVIWLMGVHTTGTYDRYTILFTDPVGGLVEEGPVKYNGVQVGKILDVRLGRDRNDLVKIDVEARRGTPIHSKTIANIKLQGITGQSYIDLSTPSDDKTPPLRVEGERYPVIKGFGNRFDKFIDDLPQLGQDLRAALSGVQNFSQEGAKTADSIRGLADELKEDPSKIINPPSRKGVEIPK